MCDPVSIGLTLVSTLASSYLQSQAAKQVQNSRSSVIRRTEADLQSYRDKANTNLQESQKAAAPAAIQAGMARQTADRTADYQAATSEPQNIVSSNASDAAKGAISKALGTSRAFSLDQAHKRALSEAYGGAATDRDIQMARDAQKIGMYGDFARGRVGVSNLQLDHANHAGDGYANAAGIASALGTVGNAAYGAGAGAGYWGGTDPSTGIKWNAGRANPANFVGPVRTYTPYQ